MSAYGVEMVLKRTDYLVVDDRATGRGRQTSPVNNASTNESGMFREVLGDDPWAETASPITKDELRGKYHLVASCFTNEKPDIGVKATSLIMASEKPLDALLHLSQDFPKYSAALARKVTVPPNIRAKSLETLDRGPVRPAIYINGKAYMDTELNGYS